MILVKLFFLRLAQKRVWKLIVILIVAGSGLYGWLSGHMIYATYSNQYIPIAPANITIIMILCSIILFNSGKRRQVKLDYIADSVVFLISIYCFVIFIQFFFKLAWDIENVFLKNPKKFGDIIIGRMSPITSLLYIFICVGYLGSKPRFSNNLKYIGGTFSLLAFAVSWILFLGYLLKAPLLYGGTIIPVSLPSTICFVLFSITLLQLYELKFFTFSLLEENKVTRLLLKSFLPIVVFLVTLEGLLITRFNISGKNSTLTIAIILLVVVVVSIILIYRVSALTGDQLHKAEMALKESDSKYRMIADYNYDWEFWISNDKQFKYNSPSCERISGYGPGVFTENPKLITKIIYPDDRPIYDQHLQPDHETTPCEGVDFRIITKSGGIKWINHVCQPVFDENGKLIGRRGSNCDITTRKNAEDMVKSLNMELENLNLDKDRFLSILGHDLKSPFNNLIGLSEILANDIHKLKRDKIEDFAKRINETANNTFNLLTDILTWANSKQGKVPFSPQSLDLFDICGKVIEILNPIARAKNICISYSAVSLKNVYADPDMLKTVLRNLISNAIKFTNKDGTVVICTVQSGPNTMLSISDNGIGIAPENLGKLFDISQVLTTPGTENESGTGLGLLLCKEFVERNGGKINIESEQGKGTRISFTLPTFSP